MSINNGLAADGGITITLEESSNGANVKDDVLSAATLYWGTIDYVSGMSAGGSVSTATAFGDMSASDNTTAFGDSTDHTSTATAFGDTVTTTTTDETTEDTTEETTEEETVTYDDTNEELTVTYY